MNRRRYLVVVSIFLTLFCAACMPGEQSTEPQQRKQVYVDANLLFEISYPEEWARAQQPRTLHPLSRETTTWRIGTNNGSEPLELSILSISTGQNPDGYDGLKNILRQQHENLAISAVEELDIPAGPSQKLVGETIQRSFDIWLHLGPKRHYIISCSSATKVFPQQREQFAQIIDSFKILE